MTRDARCSLLGLLVCILPLSACAQQQSSAAVVEQAVAPTAAVVTTPLASGLPDFTQLVEQVGSGVVNIEAVIKPQVAQHRASPHDDMPEFFRRFFGPDFELPRGGSRGGVSRGSGFVISADGYVLTNHHVVEGADEVKVKLADQREFTADVVGSDQQYDVALLKIDAKNLPAMRIGNSNILKPGQWVVAIGSPFGLDHSVTAGIVSATGRSNPYTDQRYVPFIQTDVAINQGNSGGPLLNTRGEVVGINSQIFSASGGYMGISFAIPIDLAISASEQIKQTGRVSRGQMGVVVSPITADIARGFGLTERRGALVNEVLVGGAAAKAGLQAGDVIRSVNGNNVNNSNDLPPMIGAMAPGSKATLGVLRDGREHELEVVLTALEGDGAAPVAAAANTPSATASAGQLLGLEVVELDAAARSQLGIASNQGVRISAVSGVAARRAGLVPGVVILQVGRTPVSSAAAFNQQLQGVKKGDVVMLLVRYRGTNSFVAIEVGN